MSENLNEVMENENNGEVYDLEPEDYIVEEGGSGKVIALVVGSLAGAAALGIAAYKKLKSKKEDKPKKKRKKLMWVEVEDDEPEAIDSTAEEIDDEEESEK